MAGPAASVLLPRRLTEGDGSSIRAVVHGISDHQVEIPPVRDGFWVGDTRSIGGTYLNVGRPFSIHLGLQAEWEPGQLSQIPDAFGFLPLDEILVVAYCNQDADHRILGTLCAYLVERFGGLLNFGGELWPPVPPEAGIDLLEADWCGVEPYFRRMVAGLPGKIVGVRYEPQPGKEAVVHVADAKFARAWLGHPQFHMVK